MRAIATALILSTACFPAFADETAMPASVDKVEVTEAMVDIVTDMGAPSIAETDRAQPDWYQQFTFSNNDISSPALQDVQSQTLNLSWIKGERWSVSVDLTSRDYAGNTALPTEEMSANAEFMITPRISVGGEVSFGTTEAEKIDTMPTDQTEAGIRLRSAFKF